MLLGTDFESIINALLLLHLRNKEIHTGAGNIINSIQILRKLIPPGAGDQYNIFYDVPKGITSEADRIFYDEGWRHHI